MAERRGGRRPAPRAPQPPAGPGRFANRGGADGQGGLVRGPQRQAVTVPPGQLYGDRQRFEAAQAAAPVPARRQGPERAPPSGGGGGPPGPAPGAPRDLGALLARPTERPGEPLTAGLAVGAGAGPEATGRMGPDEAAAFKVDLYGYLMSLPYASPEIEVLYRKARSELAMAQAERQATPLPSAAPAPAPIASPTSPAPAPPMPPAPGPAPGPPGSPAASPGPPPQGAPPAQEAS